MGFQGVWVGQYELVCRLGIGGMAETFVAIRHGPAGFQQKVCLKRILAPFDEDPEFVRLFLEEARLSARLRHANIVQVLDFGQVDGSHFLTLELVEGLDLKALLAALKRQGRRLPPELVSQLALELGSALGFAHAREVDGQAEGIVHRDVSPSNVLVSNAGEVKLTDFGIAKAVRQPGDTRTGVVKGKVPYMPPEYAQRGHFDARGDLFALGVTLYECLAGRRPFDGINELDTLAKTQKGEHLPLGEHCEDAPAALIEAVERLIRPDPEERFPDANAFVDALVEAAPRPTARRALGEYARACSARPAGGSNPSETGALPFQSTRRARFESKPDSSTRPATPGRCEAQTAVADYEGSPHSSEAELHTVRAASASAATRTQPSPIRRGPVLEQETRAAGNPQALTTATPAHAAAHSVTGRTASTAAGAAPAPGETAAARRAASDAADPDEDPQAQSLATAEDANSASRSGIRPQLPARDVRAALATLLLAGAGVATWILLSGDWATDGDDAPLGPSEAEARAEPGDNSAHNGGWPDTAAGAVSPDTTTPDPTLLESVSPGSPVDFTGATPSGPAEGTATDVPPENDARTTPPSKSQRAAPATPQDGADTDRPRASRRRKRRWRAPARVEVVVVPFGDVWVDGRRRGTAPLVLELPAGPHTIAAGVDEPGDVQRVRLRPGTKKRVMIRRE